MSGVLPGNLSQSTVDQQILINNYLHVAAITCLFYDYSVTFGTEVTFIWEPPKSLGAYSFLVNRYFAIIANIIIVIPGIGENAHSAQVRSIYILQVQLSLRVYALYKRSLRLLMFMVMVASTLVGITCWTLFHQMTAIDDTELDCKLGISHRTPYSSISPQLMSVRVRSATRLAAAWECLIAYDTMLFGFLVYKACRYRRRWPFDGHLMPLHHALLQDGIAYYLYYFTDVLALHLQDTDTISV
ncbi:hypothetical protein JR316_0001835 [Psilocybe cubensis]|uniref:DUF6533 domain-containing protein n=2 Tax=Psilocybe cubensis TaxID=181762 RepID=A0A8H8CPQ1_PSICU|nr:hypothetical protein JR316_0001835 [Psilocybe cubensis]KAH9484931.1 hypothetical protein JR316_0001835 [Psilocybe cubensis]